MFKKLGMSSNRPPSPSPLGRSESVPLSSKDESVKVKKSSKELDETSKLRKERDALKAELALERAAAFDMKTRLDSLTMNMGGSLGLQSVVEIRRASNVSLNGAASAMLLQDEDDEGDGDDDEFVDMGSILSERPRTPKGRPGLGPKQTSQSRRRLDNLQGGVLRRNQNRDDTARNTAFIASFLSEHLNNKQDVDATLRGAMTGEVKIGSAVPTLASPPFTSSTSSAQAPKPKEDPAMAAVASQHQRRPSSARALHNRTPSFLKKLLAHKSSKLSAVNQLGMFDGMISLPRGGVYVASSIGPIQFGMPPETVKDSMELGMNVPNVFVVPPERFNLHEGVNVAEIEFPAFFNYFVLRKKMTLITYKETESEIRAIMQEALLGPTKDLLFVDSEYSKFVSPEVYAARANLEAELAYFAAPSAPDFYQIGIDQLVNFAFFDDEGKVDLGGGVVVQDDMHDGFMVIDSGERFKADKAKMVAEAAANGAEPAAAMTDALYYESFVTYDMASSCLQVPPSMKTVSDAASTSFVIPQFGITVLGNGHGFDPESSTSGFVVWVNGQGAMVDPPPHSTMLLAKAGIEPKAITAIILTHCHADHEVGTIQKLVTEDKVVLLTTKTIMESFLRKYEAVTGLEREFLQQLVMFRPVYLEEPTYWNGASFRFFYSLHSIPCIGFEATFEGKRVVYSADTYFDQVGLLKMHADGVLSKPRLDALLAFPWDADVVLHEMGVPPIHTPLEALEKLPPQYRENIYLIHIAAKTARDAQKRGFKIATPGVEHTITLVKPAEEQVTLLKFLQLVSTMDLFRGFSLSQALELWFMARKQTYNVGSNIVEQGAPGDKFLIILKGNASVVFGGNKKVFRPGDFLGEVSVVTGETRSVTVTADTEVVTFEVDRYAFDYLIMHDSKLKVRMNNLIKTRSDGSWGAIAANQLLSRFTSSQKTQMQALLTSRILRKGDVVWAKGESVTIGVIISKGFFKFQEISDAGSGLALVPGMLVFDMGGAMSGHSLTTTLVADTDVCQVFSFEAESMLNYMDLNPLLLLALLKSIVII